MKSFRATAIEANRDQLTQVKKDTEDCDKRARQAATNMLEAIVPLEVNYGVFHDETGPYVEIEGLRFSAIYTQGPTWQLELSMTCDDCKKTYDRFVNSMADIGNAIEKWNKARWSHFCGRKGNQWRPKREK